MSILIPYISFETPYPSMDDRGMLMLDLIIPTHVNLESRRRRGCNPRVWNPGFTAGGNSSIFIYVLAYCFRNIWSSRYKCLAPPQKPDPFPTYSPTSRDLWMISPRSAPQNSDFRCVFSWTWWFPQFFQFFPQKNHGFSTGIPTIHEDPVAFVLESRPRAGAKLGAWLRVTEAWMLQLDISKLSGGRTMPWIVTTSDYNIIVFI